MQTEGGQEEQRARREGRAPVRQGRAGSGGVPTAEEPGEGRAGQQL